MKGMQIIELTPRITLGVTLMIFCLRENQIFCQHIFNEMKGY